jgi:hypothetical protein
MNNKDIRMEYGVIKTDAPDQQLITLIESMGRCVRETECHFKYSRWNRLVEIYYYLRYGLYGYAWIKINDLRDDLRWRIPGDVYHSLKEICKNMEVKIA